MKSGLLIVALLSAGVFATAYAQVAGTSTTLGVSAVESSQVALGWSVKKSILGKTVYSESGQKVGKVEDLIVAPSRNLSFMIIGAGGFVGIGRHDVAVPVSQLQNLGGKLVMPGATPASIKALPAFEYAKDSAQREAFLASADEEIAKAKADIAALQKRAGAASADAKAALDTQITALQPELKAAEAKLADLRRATVNRWKEFESAVSAATVRLRKSIDKAMA